MLFRRSRLVFLSSYICTLAMSKCYEKVRVFFSARQLSHFTRQVAHFTRSSSSGKMLAFQPRGFVFEPVGMRLFFYKYSEAESSHFFRHYETFRLCETFFEIQKVLLSFLMFCNRTNVKNLKGSLFQIFRHYETVQNSHFLFSKIF